MQIYSIKLIEDISYKQIFRATVPVFNIVVLFAALEFLYEYSLRSESPLVIYIPLGSNLGNHNGNSILDQFIDFISINADIIIVTVTVMKVCLVLMLPGKFLKKK